MLNFAGYKMNTAKPLSGLKKAILSFLFKLALLIAAWQTMYRLILKPARIPARWITDFLTACTTKGLNYFYSLSPRATWIDIPPLVKAAVMQHGRSIFEVADGCNGMNLMATYLGLIILLPYPLKRKLIFGIGGIMAIIFANIIRCICLYWIYEHHRSLYEINHHYVFTFLIYLLIIYGWYLFTRKRKVAEVLAD